MPRGSISDLQKSLIGVADRQYASKYLGLFTFAQLMYYITCFVDPGYVRVSPRYQVVLSVTLYNTMIYVKLRRSGDCLFSSSLHFCTSFY